MATIRSNTAFGVTDVPKRHELDAWRWAMSINSGGDDEFMIEAEATKLYSLLRADRQLAELRIVDNAHSWVVWERTIDDALKYISLLGQAGRRADGWLRSRPSQHALISRV